MSDNEWNPTKARLSIAQDLTEIVRMFAALRVEAVNRAGDPDIPGGMAMVLLGPGADVEAFGYAQMSELMGRTNKNVWMPDKGDVEPPLSYLASWNDIIREARGQEPSSKRAALGRETEAIRHALDWMLSINDDGEPWFIQVEDFTNGLHKVRCAMENVLHDGERLTRIKARCMWCEESPRLARHYVDGAKDDSRDYWFCPGCKHGYDLDGVTRALHHEMHLNGADGWINLTEASRSTGRNIKTLRWWATPPAPYEPAIISRRHPRSGRIEVRWSAVRDLHAARPTRERIPRSA